MEKHRFIKSKTRALEIWQRKNYYRMENFLITDVIKIYILLYPETGFIKRKKYLKSFVSTFSTYSVSEVSSSTLKDWFNKSKTSENLSERTLAQIKCQINNLFKWMFNEGLISTNPLKEIKFKRNQSPKRPRIIFEERNLSLLIKNAKAFDHNIFYPFLYTIIHTGARRSEVMKLEWDHVDLSRSQITFANTKNGESRRINIAKSLSEVIENQPRKGKFVFANGHGTYLGRAKAQRLINHFKSLYPEFGNWNYHDLRHSFAFNFLNNGGEMYQLQAILGHKTIQMTVDLYGNFKSQNVKNPSPYSF